MPKTNEDKLAAIRFIMETFDWDRDDRQLALEEIDRIIFDGDGDA